MPNQASKRNFHERRVRALFIEKGMFISRLDRPWSDTPFWLQGFMLKTDQELSILRKYCQSAYIDISRGKTAEHYMEDHLELRTSKFLENQIKKKKHRVRYQNSLSLKDELATAQEVLELGTAKFDLVMENIQDGKKLGLKLLPSLIEPMVDSIMRNSDALPLLCRLRNKQNLTYFHAIDACVLGITFGRFMGLPLKDLRQLATGTLLLDIGKANIADEILNKTQGLTDEEYGIVCTHVEHGVNFLKQDETLSEDIINMVMAHHERSDGSGYPNGLKEKRIPAFAKMAAVIDCYNAMSTQRPFRNALTPYRAVQEIYNLREKYFQPELVEKFLHCIGTYPNGSLVEFNTGEVGVVIAQNPTNRLKPQILPLLDPDKKPYRVFRVVDMLKKPMTNNGKVLSIIRDLDHNSFGIDLDTVYDKLKMVVPEQEVLTINVVSSLSDKIFFFFEDLWEKILGYFRSPSAGH